MDQDTFGSGSLDARDERDGEQKCMNIDPEGVRCENYSVVSIKADDWLADRLHACRRHARVVWLTAADIRVGET